jgi:molecular chaperone GrpE
MEEEDLVPEEGAEEELARLKKLREKLKTVQAERQEYLDASQRLRADYLNLRRETEAERETLLKTASAGLLAELLEVADGFEQAMGNAQAWQQTPESWRQGMEQIYAKLQAIFTRHGLEEINPLGEMFDPTRHQAVGLTKPELDGDGKMAEENRISAVVQKGYRLGERLIRPARVKIIQA